ncbi:flavin-dependent oxidoreductase [Mesorhizobium retamae]|uniref:Flavin-dependent oxidoreductase n=1 Tax=Mesorhizobium retamae TaxID=2912854 RepID=A0ABS9QDU3_9HYPH|nr:flavin-dependent oxidoreductase [Mesorhizobium sp. IRAMC:0171]MCG7505592.1 flavin-dependent oxidoreductase [Mesorhizobium sp. IRAMC:0171]
MKILIAGGGIGGLATALCLHAAGIEAEVFEQASSIRELGVGINVLPHAIKELAALGLLPALDETGIRTRELIYTNRFGQAIWQELRGLDAGYDMPQLSIHRGKLLQVLFQAVMERLGPERIHIDHKLVGFQERGDRVVARFDRTAGSGPIEAEGDALIGADGIHSKVRSILYPDQGQPIWSGIMIWRGAVEWPVYQDGRTMVIAGSNTSKFVFYPIHADPAKPDKRLTNWAVMARTDAEKAPPGRGDWNRPGRLEETLAFVRDKFRLGFVDPVSLIEATGPFYEYPNCDRDPVARWSFGRVSLLGDAAHPMYPVGSNGASQAVLDATCLARHLSSVASVQDALSAYDVERRTATSEIVLANRKGGPEGVIDMIEKRAPDGFDDIERVASYEERKAIVRGYATMAGFSRDQVNTKER